MRDKNYNPDTAAWINPTGGLGDILILSGVLKLWVDKNPGLKFNLVRRAIYTDLLKGHPAIGEMGFPPKDAKMITNDYWRKEKLGGGIQRPFQVIARSLGLQTPVEEILFLPDDTQHETSLIDFIPGTGEKIVIIAPSSSSPRKMMAPIFWHVLVETLNKKGVFVVQVGHKEDVYIKGAYSLLGLTSPRQLVYLLRIGDVIVSVDNFIMHAAHLIRKDSIITWGPTQSEVYGYPEQYHINTPAKLCSLYQECLGPEFPENYKTSCPKQQDHCMNKIDIEEILETMNNWGIFGRSENPVK